jgi:hypothetical protein
MAQAAEQHVRRELLHLLLTKVSRDRYQEMHGNDVEAGSRAGDSDRWPMGSARDSALGPACVITCGLAVSRARTAV